MIHKIVLFFSLFLLIPHIFKHVVYYIFRLTLNYQFSDAEATNDFMAYSSFLIDADPCRYKDLLGESATIDFFRNHHIPDTSENPRKRFQKEKD
jgi:hypothetical protein